MKTPEPVSCQLTGKTGMGASTKNWFAAVARTIAFHATGPVNAPTATATSTPGLRWRPINATSTTASNADSAAPYAMTPEGSIVALLPGRASAVSGTPDRDTGTATAIR
ncbi:MAG TPA: hypothetical protein VGD71_30315 [Kribbella sp.]